MRSSGTVACVLLVICLMTVTATVHAICEPDITPAPGQNALSVPVNVSVSATFSESMDAGTMDAASYVIHGRSSGPHFGTITSGSTLVSMDPDDAFAPGEVVTATVTNSVECDSGEPLLNGYTWQFTTDVTPSLGSFAAATPFGAGDGPISVFASDLDGDGDLDLATANNISDNTSILLNNGDGSFAAATHYSTGDGAYLVFAADLDGDGDLDLATAHWYDNVSVLLNNGDGSYAAATPFGTGDNPFSVFAADLDNDGDLDLATANSGSDNVSVLLNNGDGSFAAATHYSAGDYPISVFSADLDGDGDLDLATANYNSDIVSVLLNEDILLCEPDITPAPEQNAHSVPVNVSVSATFSENMDSGTMDNTSYVIRGHSSGPHFGTITSSSTLISIDPDDAFAPGEVVTATLTNSIDCENGEPLLNGYTWQFTTDVTPSQGSFAATTPFSAP